MSSDARPRGPRHREAAQEATPAGHDPSAVAPSPESNEGGRPDRTPAEPGPEPDYLPDGPSNPMPHYWPAEPETKG